MSDSKDSSSIAAAAKIGPKTRAEAAAAAEATTFDPQEVRNEMLLMGLFFPYKNMLKFLDNLGSSLEIQSSCNLTELALL